jgi:Type ISP C-terminal specificity domain
MASAQDVPQSFKDAVRTFAESLKANFSSLIEANPEDQLKPAVQDLLGSTVSNVITRSEAQLHAIGARPDIGVSVSGLLCGYVELKAPGKGARVTRLRGSDKAQWEKFKSIPNILYTDSTEWALYRSGELVNGPIRFSSDVTTDGIQALNDEITHRLYALLIDFLTWEPIAPTRPKDLAELLAPLCRLLRQDVFEVVQNEESNLAQLAREWRVYLFPDADDSRFADAYAQTLTYALLLARLNGETDLTTVKAAAALDSGHGLLAQTLRVLTQAEARFEISTSIELLERIIRVVNPEELQSRGDPWLYFYEDFLSSYDPKLRRDYGVYYTPVEVIHAQVCLVSELLENRFEKPLSYADDGVVFLDPAAGTAAYPLGAIQHALEKAAARFGEGIVGARASECAVNFNAFEILVGPYAVAHLRLTQIIENYGGSLPEEGIRVFLTDTLESPHANPPQPNLFARKLTEEHRRALDVKRHTRVLVCMGNPPYDREERDPNDPDEQRKGGWVRHTDRAHPNEIPILQDFIEPAIGVGAGVHVKNLYNDYVYFWRWALWKLFENPEASGPGVISFISASSYLRGPGFVGMRQKMRESFDELWIVDLEGGKLGARKTDNVFAIRTPVAIAIGVRYGAPQPEVPARVRYTKLTGRREEKLAQLEQLHRFEDLTWSDCFRGWMQPFLPEQTGDYFSWPLLTDLFPWQHSGVQFKRTWPIGETQEVLYDRWNAMLAQPGDERAAMLRETDARKSTGKYRSFLDDHGALTPIAELSGHAAALHPIRYAFRTLDRQWILPDARLCDRPRPPLWNSHSDRQIYLTSLLSDVLGLGPAVSASSLIPDLHHFSGRGGKDVIPLYRDSDATEANVTKNVLPILSREFGFDVSAEDLCCYCYCILSSPAYVDEFSEELTHPGPRIPITKDSELFRRAVDMGQRLICLHTFGDRFMTEGLRQGELPQGAARNTRGIPTSPEQYPEDFAFNSLTEILRVGEGEFAPVTSEVWEFTVSGLPVLQSWLNYRKKSGAGRSSSPLDAIRPDRWTATMTQELLEVIWVLEATLEMHPEIGRLFTSVIESTAFTWEELPQPSEDERQPPREDRESLQGSLI